MGAGLEELAGWGESAQGRREGGCGEGAAPTAHRDDVGDALHALAEDVVGEEESLLQRRALLRCGRGGREVPREGRANCRCLNA